MIGRIKVRSARAITLSLLLGLSLVGLSLLLARPPVSRAAHHPHGKQRRGRGRDLSGSDLHAPSSDCHRSFIRRHDRLRCGHYDGQPDDRRVVYQQEPDHQWARR